jgi:putative transposase
MLQQTGIVPNPRAVRETIGNEVVHRTNVYLNNRIEQNRRGTKQRYYPMCGFENFASATRFCCAFDELHHYFRPRHTQREPLPLAQQRRLFRERLIPSCDLRQEYVVLHHEDERVCPSTG